MTMRQICLALAFVLGLFTATSGFGQTLFPLGGGSGSGGTPGGADTQVQFNDSGAFGGSSLFTFNKTTGNVTLNNYFASAQSTVSAGGTTILTASSGRYQALTGAASQTFRLPDATTLSVGLLYAFNNNSSDSLIITNAGGTTLYTVPAGGFVQGGPTNVSTANGSWDWHPVPPSTVTWGSGTTGFVLNTALSSTPSIGAGTPSATSPVFIPRRDALTTGIGAQAAGNLSLIAAGTETARVTSTGVKIGAGSEITSSGAGGSLAAIAFSASAADLSTGTLAAGRMPALTGDCTTSAGAVATTCTSINGVNQTTDWTSYSPTIASSTGTLTSYTTVAAWKNIGKTCFITIDISITNNGTGATALTATLPSGVCGTANATAGYAVLTGADRTTNGKAITGLINASGTTVSRIVFYDNTYPAATGVNLTLSGVYQAN